MRNLNEQKAESRKLKAENGRWASFAALCFPLFAFSLPFALYVFTLAPGLLNDDPAEYQTMLPALGIAHPTGYPLYTLVGHLFTRLVPLGDMAYRVNLFSAVCGAAAIAVLYQLLRALNVAPIIALLGSFALAVSSDFWTYATIAQTYALNSFFIALTLWMFVRYQRRQGTEDGGRRALIALAFVMGLGFAHHSTFWLLAPALVIGHLLQRSGALALVISDWHDRRVNYQLLITHYLFAIIAFLLPLLFYLYIPLRGDYLMATIQGEVLGYPKVVTDGWVTPHYLEGWTNVVMGSFYASSTAAGTEVDWLRWLHGIGDYFGGLLKQFGVEIVSIILLPFVLWRRNANFGVLLVVAWITNVVIVMRGVSAFNEPAGGLYTPTYLFYMIGFVVIIDTVARRSAQYMELHKDPWGWLWNLRVKLNRPTATAEQDVELFISLCLLFVQVAWSAFNGVTTYGSSQQNVYHNMARQQLSDALPRNAVILGAWSQITSLHYLQIVEDMRSDVSIIHAPLTAPVGQDLMNRALDENRPLYLLHPGDKLVAIPLHQSPTITNPLMATFGGEITLLGYGPILQNFSKGNWIHFTLYWRTDKQTSTDYNSFVHVVDVNGNQPAGGDLPPVSPYFPTHLWRVGQVFRDDYTLFTYNAIEYIEVALYNPVTMQRLTLPDGQTSIRIPIK